MTTPTTLRAAVFLSLSLGCGGAIAPEPSADAGTPITAADAGDDPRTNDPWGPDPVREGDTFMPPKVPPPHHGPKVE